MATISYRPAELGDAPDILTLLLELAPEMPLLVDSLAREEALYAEIRTSARSGESWLAIDAAQRIVGFVLVEPNQSRRHYAENEILDLRYAGVASGYRDRGIFGDLLGKVCGRMVPVTAAVPAASQTDLAQSLEQAGFRETGVVGGSRQFRWEPGV